MSSIRKKLLKAVRNTSGSALVGVAALAIILSITAAGLIMVVTSASRNETIALNDTRAFLAAESGLLLGAKWINDATNWTAFKGNNPNEHDRETIIQETELTVNNMKVQVELEKTALGVLIISTAKSSDLIGYDKEVSQDAVPYDSIFPPVVFDKAIICDEKFDFNGCGDVVGGVDDPVNIHSNDEIVLIGNVDITQRVNITSSVKISANNTNNINITKGWGQAEVITDEAKAMLGLGYSLDPVDPISIPDIDLTPWFYAALANGQVYDSYTQNGGDVTPPGDIIWVNGNASLGGTANFFGTIIATGNVSLGGQSNLYGPDDDFAIASIGGDVTHNSGGKIKGLVYVKNGNYTQGGNAKFEGQIIAKGEINMGGTPSAIVYPMADINIPNTNDPGGCMLVMGTWWEKNI